MDHKLNEFDDLIKQKTNNYKNICLLWKNWIKIKQMRFENEINVAIEKLRNIENILEDDVPMENLITLLVINELDSN